MRFLSLGRMGRRNHWKLEGGAVNGGTGRGLVVSPAVHCHRSRGVRVLRISHRWASLRIAFWTKYLRGQIIALVADHHCIANFDQLVQFFQIVLLHAQAPVRGSLAYGAGSVGPVDSVAFAAQSYPARSHRV